MLINYGINRKEKGKRIEHRNGRVEIPDVTNDNWDESHELIKSVIAAINPGWLIAGWAPTPKEETVFIKLRESGHIDLPTGYIMYWEPNGVGGRVYTSNEIPPGVTIMDTCLQNMATLQIAMAVEAMLRAKGL